MNRRLSRHAGGSHVRHTQWLAAAAVAIGAFSPQLQSPANAATDNWVADSSNWSNPANWSGDEIPGNFDTVLIDDDDSVDRTITYDYAGPPVTLATLAIVNTGGGTNTLAVGASSQAVISESLLIGASGAASTLSGVGVLTQSGGINQIADNIYLGQSANDNGTYNLQNGELITGVNNGGFENLYVGYSGTGTVNQSGGDVLADGTNPDSNVYIGYNAGATGVYNLTSGTILIPSDSESEGPPNLVIGYSTGSVGSLTLGMGSPTLIAGDYMAVGYYGTGSFAQQSGTTEVGLLTVGGVFFGNTNTGSGSVALAGGNLIIQGSNWLIGAAKGATGSAIITGAQVGFLYESGFNEPTQGATGLALGAAVGATGSLSLVSGSIDNGDGATVVGAGGTGFFTQSGGSNFAGTLFVGGSQDNDVLSGEGEGFYTLSGGALTVGGSEFIAGNNNATGAFTQSGGTNVTGTLYVTAQQFGNGAGNGSYSLCGGSLAVAATEVIGGGVALFNQSGGSNTTGSLSVSASGTNGSAAYIMSGGTLTVSMSYQSERIGAGGTGTFIQSGGENSTPELDLGGSAPGFYTLSGTGILSVSGREFIGDQNSATFIQTGGSNLISSGGEILIGLSGRALYALTGGNLSVAGQLEVESDGTLSITDDGSLTLTGPIDADGTLALGIQSLTSFNQIVGDRDVSVGGLLELEFSPGYVPHLGDTIPIIEDPGGSEGGRFSSLQVIGFYNGGHFAVEYNPADNPGGVDVEFVPEPAIAAPLMLGAIALTRRRRRKAIKAAAGAAVAAGFVTFGVCAPGNAQTDNWIAGNSDWNTPANWSLGTAPSGGIVNISDDDAQDRTITYDYTGPQVTLSTLTIVNTGGGTNTLAMGDSSPTLTADYEIIGFSGSGATLSGVGVITQGSSINTATEGIYVGFNTQDSGTYDLEGGVLALASDNNYVGYSGSGTLNQGGGLIEPISSSGAPNQTIFLCVGYNSGANGVYNMSAGSASIGEMILGNASGATGSLTLGQANPSLVAGVVAVGLAGTGSFVMQSGTAQVGNFFIAGESSGPQASAPPSGSFNMSGGTLVVNGSGWYVANTTGANASCTVSGGSIDFVSQYDFGLQIGNDPNATGTFFLTGGIINNGIGTTVLGQLGGTGIFVQSSGTNIAGTLDVGTDSSGSYLLSGGSLATYSAEGIGNTGNGGEICDAIFNQSGGTNTAGTLYIGSYGTASYILADGALNGSAEYVGTGSTGSFIQSGGVNTVGTLFIGGSPNGGNGGIGSYMMTGGTLSVAGTEFLADSSTGSMVQSGGNNSAATLVVGYQNGRGSYTLSGAGALAISGAEFVGENGSATFIQTGGSNTAGTLYLGDQNDAGSYTLSGAGTLTSDAEYVGYEASGSFVQSGGSNTLLGTRGNLDIGVSNVGTYLLSGGILSVGGQIDIGSERGDSLSITGGTATAGSLFNTGTLSVTNDGSLTLTGPYTQYSQGTLALGIQSLTAFNQILADGTITLAGLLELDLGTGYSPQLGDTFPIFVNSDGRVAGTFSSLQVIGFYNGGHFAVEYNPADNPGGVDVEFVPEPGCAALLLTGALAAFRRPRRRRYS
ncbi:MAG TPA: PEP-CTERM sorting domain-containing protein [Tepidisphaeraceae bacterium]|nr:PEP-CTERM sorting domain-containing protein [Tepidisphaeraceae bacterium]